MQKKNKEDVFKAFGNRERVQLICCLAKAQSVTELLDKCELSQSALSQHLKILKDAEIIGCVRDGKKQMYSVKNKKMLAIARALLRE